MDEHDPDPGNGKKYLKEYGLLDERVSSLNLFLDGITAGPEGALQIARGLTENYSLTALEMRKSDVGQGGAVPLGQALVTNKTLTYLGLGRNKLGNSGGMQIAEAVKHNQTLLSLDLEWNDLRDEAGVALADMMASNNSLLTLSLERNKLQKEGMAALGSALAVNKKLKTLNLGWNRAKIVGAISLADGLRQNNTLVNLNLAMNQIGPEGSFAIANSLSENSTLVSLNLQHNRVAESVVMIGEALRVNTSLKELNLESCSLTAENVVFFAKALAANTTLKSLNLSRNELGDAGVSAVAKALTARTNIRLLDLSETTMTHLAVEDLAGLLDTCPNLQTLVMEDNHIGHEGVKWLAAKLRGVCPLTALNLNRTKLEAKGVKCLAEAIQLSPVHYLRDLQLASNAAGTEAALALTKALCLGNSLASLDLCNNDISEQIEETLCHVLVSNPHLPYIYLKGNPIASEYQNAALYRDEAQPMLKNLAAGLAHRSGSGKDLTLVPPSHVSHHPHLESQEDPYVPSSNFASANVATGGVNNNVVSLEEMQSVPNPKVSHVNTAVPPRGMASFIPGDKDLTNEERAARNVAEAAVTRRTNELFSEKRTDQVVSPFKTARMVHRPNAFQSSRLEGNINELLLTDDQLRKEFNKLDRDGNGWLAEDEFRSIYKNFDNFGVTPSERELNALIKKNNMRNDGKITFNEYCVIMLGLARR
eukprot:TRINITY_DN32091_c0_g1_i1.p1 TRINITY_DN32091_c0_g1~~TRINITY_DN32091_c0_g1_i1.p1  ORF type:complete len:706 (+),score=241.17 TRINITY_DN32091_c0_g1_i1:65-2182(+)